MLNPSKIINHLQSDFFDHLLFLLKQDLKNLKVGPMFLSTLLFFVFISWRLITLQYGSGFYHTLT